MATDAERVRELIGESIPQGGTAADTMFTDAQILDWLATEATVKSAAVHGWRLKAAEYAELVDTAEGTSKRSMSDLHKNALAMAAALDGSDDDGDSGSVPGRTRVRQIVRR